MTEDNPKKALIIAGATGVGKSNLAYSICSEIGGEIISADSRQLYRDLVIGTARLTDSDIEQHLVGILNFDESPNASWWAEEAARIMDNLAERGTTPVIVGGTGLYIMALTEGLFPDCGRDQSIRDGLIQKQENGVDLFEELKRVDPRAATTIDSQNPVRVIRALEVYYTTGQPISSLWNKAKSPARGWKFICFNLTRERKELYSIIEKRTRKMFSSGWIDEVRNLIDKGLNENSPALNSIGYRQIFDYLDGKKNLETAVEEIITDTRHYAKRQITWFKKRKGFYKINLTGKDPVKTVNLIIKRFHEDHGH